MKRRFLLFLLGGLLLTIIFLGWKIFPSWKSFQNTSEQIACIFYPEIMLEEPLRAFVKDYKASSGFVVKIYYANKHSGNMLTAIPKMLQKLQSSPERYDVIMLVSNPALQLEEETVIASYIDESTIVKINAYLSLGVNKLSKNRSQAIDLIENIAWEYQQGWLHMPAWQRKKMKTLEQ